MTTQITPSQIFAADQILTVAKAKELIGKKIACTYPVYSYNKITVEEIVITGMISEWDLAAKNVGGKYGTQQNYWASYMSSEQIAGLKSKLVLLTDNGPIPYYSHNGAEFTCGDMDRPVYFVELKKCIIMHSTKGFFQSSDKWITRVENVRWAKIFDTVEEAISVAKTLTSLGGAPLNRLQIGWVNVDGEYYSKSVFAEVDNTQMA